MAESMYRVRFLEKLRHATLCRLKLGERDVAELRHAIEKSYNFEFIIDGLRLQNLIGFIADRRLPPHNRRAFMWTHHHFSFQYNRHHIISVNITVSRAVELHHPPARQLKLKQTYSVDWSETVVKYENRLTIPSSLLPMTKAKIPHLATYGPPFLALLICILASVHLLTTLNKDLNNNSKGTTALPRKRILTLAYNF